MRRFAVLLVSLVVLGLLAGPAVAAEPVGTCPPRASGFALYPINNPSWTTSDPVPVPGQEPIWDLTVAGLLQVFPTLEDAATELGFGTVANIYAAVLSGALSIDKNGDFHICLQSFPVTPGIPPYLLNGIDNRAHLP